MRHFEDLRRYDGRFWTMAAVRTILSAGFGALAPFTGLYLHREIGMSMSGVGLVMLCSAILGAGAQVAGGELIDRVGRVPVLRLVMLLRVVLFTILAWLTHWRAGASLVVTLYMLTRLAGAFGDPATRAIVADLVAPADRTKAYGIMRIGWNIGWGLGPALGGFLIAFGYLWVFLMPAVASLTGWMLILLNLPETSRMSPAGKFRLSDVLDPIRNRVFMCFCFFTTVMCVLIGQLVTTLSVFSVKYVPIPASQLGHLYMVNGLVVVFLQWPATLWCGRMRARYALMAGCLLYTAGYFSVAFARSLPHLLAAVFVITLGEVIFTPTVSAVAANMAPENRRGRYLGFFGLAESVSWGIGPWVGGLLMDAFALKPVLVWGPLACLGVAAATGFLAMKDLDAEHNSHYD